MAADTDIHIVQLAVLFTACFFMGVQQVKATPECKAMIQEIKDCWDAHPELPDQHTPGNKTTVANCALSKLYKLQACPFNFTWQGAHHATLFAQAMELIHVDVSLHEEFRQDRECWKDARYCARPIALAPKERSNELCLNVSKIVDDCKSKEHNPYRRGNCSDYIAMFVDAFYAEAKLCGSASLLGHLGLVLLMFILSFSSI